LWITLIAETLDIAETLIFKTFPSISPYMVFQYIASGLIGTKSVGAGMASVALGCGNPMLDCIRVDDGDFSRGQPEFYDTHAPSSDLWSAVWRNSLCSRDVYRATANASPSFR
jgi:hypothetical protein